MYSFDYIFSIQNKDVKRGGYMIYRVLELYLNQKKAYRKRSARIANVKYNLIVTYICLIILSVLAIVGMFVQASSILIAEATTFGALYLLLFIMDRKNIKKSDNKIKVYDDFLKELKDKLVINGINWADAKRIEYLITKCDDLINAQNKERRKIIRYAEIIILPMVKFVADITKDKVGLESMTEIISIILILILTAFIFCAFINIVASFIDLLLKTGSITEIRNLKNTLMDIKMRQN